MKDIKSIIKSHIYENPLYKKVYHAKQCRDILNLLERRKRELIVFAYVRDNTMFLAVTHPLAKQELSHDSSIKMIKNLLKMHILANENSIFKNITQIVVFVLKNIKFQAPKDPFVTNYPKFKQKSKGEFVNRAKTDTIYNAYEELREILRRNIVKS
ncbi:hypothetical protein LMG7974_00235 [Campylobacter majalis]|uniref:DUF721 domain-containing protein n=1 Tax=Campylobacter majalis TaxID=2790656 RepID=A0ABM8Q397_9BACT|nr:hypothetical protein [Campylobacter majalis]CAD7287316.1 hypothetical protein LMG7974_00235 [Campylobacter majalis]